MRKGRLEERGDPGGEDRGGVRDRESETGGGRVNDRYVKYWQKNAKWQRV